MNKLFDYLDKHKARIMVDEKVIAVKYYQTPLSLETMIRSPRCKPLNELWIDIWNKIQELNK